MPCRPHSATLCYLYRVPCYQINYTDKNGSHSSTKWADSPEAALALMKKSRDGGATYEKPFLVSPQPFSDESRALHQAFWESRTRAADPTGGTRVELITPAGATKAAA